MKHFHCYVTKPGVLIMTSHRSIDSFVTSQSNQYETLPGQIWVSFSLCTERRNTCLDIFVAIQWSNIYMLCLFKCQKSVTSQPLLLDGVAWRLWRHSNAQERLSKQKTMNRFWAAIVSWYWIKSCRLMEYKSWNGVSYAQKASKPGIFSRKYDRMALAKDMSY